MRRSIETASQIQLTAEERVVCPELLQVLYTLFSKAKEEV